MKTIWLRLICFACPCLRSGNLIVSAVTLPADQPHGLAIRLHGQGYACIRRWLPILLLRCFFGTKERVNFQAASKAESLPLSQRIKALGKNKYFLIMMGATLTLAIYQTLNGTVATYYSQYVLGHNEF